MTALTHEGARGDTTSARVLGPGRIVDLTLIALVAGGLGGREGLLRVRAQSM